MSSGPDPLFDIKNAFYLGNYQVCINEAQKSKVASKEKNLFMYRAFIAQNKYNVVLNEVRDTTGIEFAAVRMLAVYMTADENNRQKISTDMDKLASQSHSPDDYVHLVVAGQVAYLEQRYEDAIKIVHGCDKLECYALTIQSLLKLDRIDLARKEWKKMQEKDEDATLTQLAQAWIILAAGTGTEKLDEAYYIFHDLSAKYGSTPLLLNGQAVSLIAKGKYEEADSLLQESLEKDSNNAETLINLITISHFLGKGSEVANRFLHQLKDFHPRHPFVTEITSKETHLRQLIQQFS